MNQGDARVQSLVAATVAATRSVWVCTRASKSPHLDGPACYSLAGSRGFESHCLHAKSLVTTLLSSAGNGSDHVRWLLRWLPTQQTADGVFP
jgi:hypothetical protein